MFAAGDNDGILARARLVLTAGSAARKHFRRGLAADADASARLIHAVRSDAAVVIADRFVQSLPAQKFPEM
jgi:hypothetical protein